MLEHNVNDIMLIIPTVIHLFNVYYIPSTMLHAPQTFYYLIV